MDDYRANSIRILDAEEDFAGQQWDWKRSADWAARYRSPVDWIERAIAACRDVGVDPEYIRRRYLEGAAIPLDLEVDRAHRALNATYKTEED